MLVTQVTTTCLSSPQCGIASPCIRGECRDLWNTFTCICPLGFGGTFCEINLDDCARTDCGNGYCVDRIGEARMAPSVAKKHVEMVEPAKTRKEQVLFASVHLALLEHSVRNAKILVKTDLALTVTAEPMQLNLNASVKKGIDNTILIGYGGKTCSDIIDKCNDTLCNGQGQCAPVWNATVCRCDKVTTARSSAPVWRTLVNVVNASNSLLTDTRVVVQQDMKEPDSRIDYCKENLCSNGGTCESLLGYIGRRCSIRDPCQPDASNKTTHSCVHGKCVNPAVKEDHLGHETPIHGCKCNRGYTGAQCSTLVPAHKVLSLSSIVGPVVAVLTVLIILGCTLLAFFLRGKRSIHGHYSPSHQERTGARLQTLLNLKINFLRVEI
ncbi:EGF-like domain protein [Ancylostoma ceylanicum]|uniref:EGF-like domain protein n=1 Tax=Ancylostoma ceylanicum TaxID=53326 RepID=A0A0D6M0Q9_9BILA|nr:EGF-like domain protein [Ancylostoma ceylanicum]